MCVLLWRIKSVNKELSAYRSWTEISIIQEISPQISTLISLSFSCIPLKFSFSFTRILGSIFRARYFSRIDAALRPKGISVIQNDACKNLKVTTREQNLLIKKYLKRRTIEIMEYILHLNSNLCLTLWILFQTYSWKKELTSLFFVYIFCFKTTRSCILITLMASGQNCTSHRFIFLFIPLSNKKFLEEG